MIDNATKYKIEIDFLLEKLSMSSAMIFKNRESVTCDNAVLLTYQFMMVDCCACVIIIAAGP